MPVPCLAQEARDRGTPSVRLQTSTELYSRESYVISVTCSKPALKLRFRARQQRPYRTRLNAECLRHFTVGHAARPQQQQLRIPRFHIAEDGANPRTAFL